MPALTLPAEFERYAAFPRELFEGNPYWRPTDEHGLIAEISNQSAYAAHSRAQAFWIVDGSRVVAVVTAMVDDLYRAQRKEKAGHLLFFDARPDCEDEAASVLEEACRWLRGQDAEFARLGLKFGWQLPYTIDAYDAPPTILHTYNPPYYHRHIKNAGFATEKGVVEFRVQFTAALAERYRQLTSPEGATLRPWDFSRLEEETDRFSRLLNDTFAEHWGFGRFTIEELGGLTHGLRDFLVPEFCWFAEVDGEAAGFVFSLPDLNQGEAITHGVLLIIGVSKKFRGRGINTALGARSYLAMIDRGYQSASYTVVLDDNWPSRRTAEKLGCRVARNFCIYRREL